ncbi:MAG: M20/M25/M40 family metallo-hydrolase [Acidobacteriota bacterium]
MIRHCSPTLHAPSCWVLALLLLSASPSFGQSDEARSLTADVRSWREGHEIDILRQLVELVRIPNVASDRPNIERNAAHLEKEFRARGFETRILRVKGVPEANPAVFAQRLVPGAKRTVVFYSHYDGQPVTPERWLTDPWNPVLRKRSRGGDDSSYLELPESGRLDPEWRLFGRGVSDDKAPIIAVLGAIDALAALEIEPSISIKIFLEGEEEAGSDHLAEILAEHRDLLAADLWLFCDGPVHQSRRQQVVFGVRGVTGVDLTIYGPKVALHSGHYGNWAPNPGARMAELLSSMRSSDGEILVAGFTDPVVPLTQADRDALAAAPKVDEQLRRDFGLAASEADNALLGERILQPALNFRGLTMARTGPGAKNAIPTEARATLGFRLVPDVTPEHVRETVEAHLVSEGYQIVRDEPTDEERLSHPKLIRVEWSGGYRALRTPLEHPASVALLEVLDEASVEPVVRAPILGGSLPLATFEDVLGAPVIVLPTVNHDNAQHAPNENLRLQNLWDAIETFAQVMVRLGGAWGA